MKKTSNSVLLVGTAALLLVGCVGLSLFPAQRHSVEEKRELAAFPTVSLAGVLDGSVTAALENYATERVPFRSVCRKLHGATELALLRAESHGVILCRDGSLCRRLTVNEVAYQKNLAALPKLQKRIGEIPFTLAVAPRRIDVRCEVLPALYKTARENEVWEALPAGAVTFLDATEDGQWYRTDHHWTAEGAYFAYVRLGRSLGYAPLPKEAFTPETVSDSFLGSSAAAAGLPGIRPDTLALWQTPEEAVYCVLRDGLPANFSGLYDRKKLDTGDPYAVFLGGNCGLTEIKRGEEDDRPTLLVIKDSFANSLLPFLARHFRILAVDPRYRVGGLQALAEEADLALVLCGMQTLTEAAFFAPLLR